ncbi:MAG: transporter ATP-binding protein [Rhodospirillales bacterium]|nr:transporter ATP-binding protein [Rhodospirillales bacterium]
MMLKVSGIETCYGESQVLFGVSLEIAAGEVVTLLGRNGMGKTTTVSSIMGIVPPRAGEILFEGKPIHGRPAYRVAQLGLGLVPEGRQIFPNLTVRENLVATAANRAGHQPAWTLASVLELFPPLAERADSMGALLSGGEQQMLAIGRALMGNPSFLLMDEPLEGLAPVIVDQLLAGFERLKREEDLALLLVEQHARLALELAEQAIVLDRGNIVYRGASRELADAPELMAELLGVTRGS